MLPAPNANFATGQKFSTNLLAFQKERVMIGGNSGSRVVSFPSQARKQARCHEISPGVEAAAIRRDASSTERSSAFQRLSLCAEQEDQ
jgi:hypothetical protein